MQNATPASSRWIALCALALAACQGGSRGAPVEAIRVEPPEATLAPGAAQEFAATATGVADTSVFWSVVEGASGGTITSGGVYTAPQATGTFHVVATSAAIPGLSGSAVVTVAVPQVGIAVTPAATSLAGCTSTTFSATVTNAADTGVTWSVQEGTSGGSIDASGQYVAPATPGTYHVVVTSQADPTRSAVAAVTVSNQVLSVKVNPATASVRTGGTVAFTATVTTTCGQFTATQALAAAR